MRRWRQSLRTMTAALIVDNPRRDLPGLALVALALARHGVTSYLVPMNLQRREIWALDPDFVLLNYLRVTNQALVRTLGDSGTRLGVLDTEGGVFASFDGYAKLLPGDSHVRSAVSSFCSWGPRLAEHAARQGWYDAQRIAVTGAPRFDYYAPRWRRAALRSSAYADAYARPLVLINGNFPLANPMFQTAEQEAANLERLGLERDYVVRLQTSQRDTLHALSGLANRLADRFPHATFVYRPHPFERLDTYRSLLAQRGNLHLVNTGTADGWILRAAAVIQRGCSTAIEAGLAGVPALSPAWVPTAVAVETADAASVACATEHELCAALEAVLDNRFTMPTTVSAALKKVVDDWFSPIDGRAHERVAAEVLRCLRAAATCPGSIGKLRGRYERGRVALIQTARRLARPFASGSIAASRLVSDAAWQGSEKSFDDRGVGELMENLLQCLAADGETVRVQVRRAGEQVDYRVPYSGSSVVIAPVLSTVEGPVLSSVEGPVLSPVEGPVLSPVEGPVLSTVEGPVADDTAAGSGVAPTARSVAGHDDRPSVASGVRR